MDHSVGINSRQLGTTLVSQPCIKMVLANLRFQAEITASACNFYRYYLNFKWGFAAKTLVTPVTATNPPYPACGTSVAIDPL